MKTLSYLLLLSIVFASCNFGAEESPDPAPVITEPSDSMVPARIDETNVEEPDEMVVEKLPDNAKKQAVESLDIIVTITPGMKVEDLETFLLICSDEVVKDARCFTMKHFKATPITDGMRKVKLNGRPFHYQEKFNGDYFVLMGYLQLGDKWYKIDAEDKDPTWIYPYLATMEPKAVL